MTSLTNAEIKTIYFGITFFILVGVFVALYSNDPIKTEQYKGETGAITSSSSGSSDWIYSLISGLPKPFNDVNLLIVTSIFVTPVSIMLAYIAVRAFKDLISQWV